ncbi:betaine--homocysteine S-methyltransferase 1-like isoform X2 [Portunus trituberculatus]|uniref:betaine--homocysteine S-methyltransferase 1-like isoform X2 n=1 Tax=Portunus trituberculatus TaxID=210409 RepID=UPI001E1CF948|nr:betaine--homocysteine S-methyltransferase 1-like isoform X2 [Portunus trituberculatus]
MSQKGLLERLQDGLVVGDGGMIFALERRGYVDAGIWTPEVVMEHPEAVKQLHREFLRAGSDVIQTVTYNGSQEKLNKALGNDALTCQQINDAACQIAREVANEGNALVAGSINKCPAYKEGKGKAAVQAQMREQLQPFVKNKVDFVILEFFFHVEEIEWAIEEAAKTGMVVVATMAISVKGDGNGIPAGECAVRMAKAGAQVVGVNCLFDPDTTVRTIKAMKAALNNAGLSPYLMTQPNGFMCPGAGTQGYLSCPEFPYALEPRMVTRFDVHSYARAAHDLGVRYIGGCCGFEPYHIRAISEEVAEERGKLPPASKKHQPWGKCLERSHMDYVKKRAGREYWENLIPSSGRLQPPSHVYDPSPEKDLE